MLDDVYKAKIRADVLILGGFNIDMLKPHSSWDSILALFGLAQLITSPTRTTPDLICTLFDNVHQHTDPNEALAVWYKLFMDVVNRHAPIRHKQVKHSKLPPWLNKNIIQAMSDRDRLKKERMFTKYKTACNKVKHLVRNAMKF